jgi:hypothetical protein
MLSNLLSSTTAASFQGGLLSSGHFELEHGHHALGCGLHTRERGTKDKSIPLVHYAGLVVLLLFLFLFFFFSRLFVVLIFLSFPLFVHV